MTFTALALATILLAQAPADQGSAQTEPAADAVQTKEEIICKKITVPGTRFKERKCAYASEWAKQKRRYVETTRELKGNRGSFKGG